MATFRARTTRQRLIPYMIGAGSILDISGAGTIRATLRRARHRRASSANDALARDWRAIGGDWWRAIERADSDG